MCVVCDREKCLHNMVTPEYKTTKNLFFTQLKTKWESSPVLSAHVLFTLYRIAKLPREFSTKKFPHSVVCFISIHKWADISVNYTRN